MHCNENITKLRVYNHSECIVNTHIMDKQIVAIERKRISQQARNQQQIKAKLINHITETTDSKSISSRSVIARVIESLE